MLKTMWAKGNTPALLMGVQTGTTPVAISVVISQKITSRSSNMLLGIYPKDAQSYHKDMCSTMFIAALFIIARTWKQLDAPQLKSG